MPAKELLLERARSLRKNHTRQEHFLWKRLKARRFANYKFRRQHIIGNYIVDFICVSKNLIIELDGDQHATQQEYDRNRTDFLTQEGYIVIRFWNNQVLKETEMVLDAIWDHLTRAL